MLRCPSSSGIGLKKSAWDSYQSEPRNDQVPHKRYDTAHALRERLHLLVLLDNWSFSASRMLNAICNVRLFFYVGLCVCGTNIHKRMVLFNRKGAEDAKRIPILCVLGAFAVKKTILQRNRQLQLPTQSILHNFLKRRDAYFLEVVFDF